MAQWTPSTCWISIIFEVEVWCDDRTEESEFYHNGTKSWLECYIYDIMYLMQYNYTQYVYKVSEKHAELQVAIEINIFSTTGTKKKAHNKVKSLLYMLNTTSIQENRCH